MIFHDSSHLTIDCRDVKWENGDGMGFLGDLEQDWDIE